MKVLHLSTYCNEDNKEFPHIFYHHNMLEMGYDSRLVCVRGDYRDEGIYHLSDNSIIRKKVNASRIARKFIFGLRSTEYYFYPEWNLDFVSAREILKTVEFNPDYIFVYWSKFSFNQKLLYELQVLTGAKIVCVPLDMAFFTGGCHFAKGCLNYQSGCGNCPALRVSYKKDLSYKTLKYKKFFLDKTEMIFLSASSELTDQMKQSSLLKDKCIYDFKLGQDENIFKPGPKNELRKTYSLNQNSKVIFFGATNLSVKQKGMVYLEQALWKLSEIIKEKGLTWDIELVVAGRNPEEFNFPFKFKYVGFLKDKNELAKMYQMADVYVSPSIEDSGPLMVNQSILSGTPVVSFDVGIAKTLVIDGETGFRASVEDSDQLAENIYRVLSNEDLEKMKMNCRNLGMDLISKESTKKFLFEFLVENKTQY